MQVPCRDEHGLRACRSSNRLHLGFLSRSPQQQYPCAEALPEHIDQSAKMGPGPLPGWDMMRGVNTDEEFLGGDGMRTQKGCDCILLTLGIGQEVSNL